MNIVAKTEHLNAVHWNGSQSYREHVKCLRYGIVRNLRMLKARGLYHLHRNDGLTYAFFRYKVEQ